MKLFFTVLILLLLPISAFASGGSPFHVDPSDLSMVYLGNLLGTIGGGTPIIGTDSFFNSIFSQFNGIVMSLGIIIAAYVAAIGTINTAHEGESMGKQWHGIWTPAKSAIGMFMLVPTATGYSYIQIFFMWLIVNGVGAANALWNTVLDYSASGLSINESNTNADPAQHTKILNEIFFTSYIPPSDVATDTNIISRLYSAALCAEKINNDYSSQLNVFIEPVIAGDKMIVGVRTPDGQSATNVCGTFTIQYPADISPSNRKTLQTNMQAALLTAYGDMIPSAIDAARVPFSTLPAETQQKLPYAFIIASMDAIDSGFFIPSTTGSSNIINQSRQQGWITAGSIYFQIASGNTAAKGAKVVPTAASGDLATMQSLSQIAKNDINNTLKTGQEYFTKGKNNLDAYIAANITARTGISFDEESKIQVSSAQQGLMIAQHSLVAVTLVTQVLSAIFITGGTAGIAVGLGAVIVATIYGLLQGYARTISIYFLTSATDVIKTNIDPLMAFTALGQKIMFGTELTWVILFTLGAGAIAFASINSATFGGSNMALFISMLVIPLFSAICALTWGSAASLGVYIPLIPFTVYLFTSLGWIIGVLEAMIAAPFVALALAAPSEDEFGKAAVSIMIIFGIALKPSLIVLGFIIGAKLLAISLQMVSFGFLGMIEGMISYLSIFGVIVIMFAFSGLVTAIVHKCFSLTYVLPEKILRWIGGHGDQMGEEQDVHAIKGAADSGIRHAQEGVTAAGTAVSAQMADKHKKSQKK